MLRPETVESLFIAYRLTGDEIYRDHGWAIFQAIEKHCRVETGGYATVVNVDENPARLEDKMETFFLVCGSSLNRILIKCEPLHAERDVKIPLSAIRKL